MAGDFVFSRLNSAILVLADQCLQGFFASFFPQKKEENPFFACFLLQIK